MPRYADDSRDKVREAADIADLIGSRVELRRAGPGRMKGLCPFHDERTPSFSVNTAEGFYHCFGCGKSGDVFTWVQDIEGLDFVGALEALAQRYGVQLEVADEDPQAAEKREKRERLMALMERATAFYERCLWETDEAKTARAYIAERGLSEEVLRKFRVGYAPSAWDTLMNAARREKFSNQEIYEAGLVIRSQSNGRLYDFFRRRIMFPLADRRGRVIGFGARKMDGDNDPRKYVNTSDSELFHKSDVVYGLHIARQSAAKAGETIVVEGYTDVLMLNQAGIENVVCSMGTALTEKQLSELSKLGDRVLLAMDSDSAGQKAMLRAEEVARGKNISLRVVQMPDGLDPADLAQQRGPDAVREAVADSVPFVRFRVEAELEAGDTSTAEGKDAVIAALRPVFAAVPPSALREELIELVAGRLDLQPAMVSSWLTTPGAAPSNGARLAREPAAHAAPAPSQRPAAMSPQVIAERDLLVALVASPNRGVPLLAELGRDRFSSDGVWRVVEYLRSHLTDPLASLPIDDDRLAKAVTGIVADAAAMPRKPSVAALQAQLATVDITAIDRQIEKARQDGTGGIAELRKRRDGLVEQRNKLIGQDLEAS